MCESRGVIVAWERVLLASDIIECWKVKTGEK